ncbi:unnamed protein product [Darwinula stevensoni]|uniref:Uncharacterized protein n=1 Tax=Darwinula stevensoni TaxID=69355 RepID=A0A7R9A6J3_9CRUS|nr:unnamed protein product [Darwinula stevensoni]CAG0888002.1 unnamed protein product [Darwinula stevensoni]
MAGRGLAGRDRGREKNKLELKTRERVREVSEGCDCEWLVACRAENKGGTKRDALELNASSLCPRPSPLSLQSSTQFLPSFLCRFASLTVHSAKKEVAPKRQAADKPSGSSPSKRGRGRPPKGEAKKKAKSSPKGRGRGGGTGRGRPKKAGAPAKSSDEEAEKEESEEGETSE